MNRGNQDIALRAPRPTSDRSEAKIPILRGFRLPPSHVLLIALFLLAGGCSSSTTEPFEIDMGYDYFPLAAGREWTYEVDSIVFSEAAGNRVRVDTIRSQLREVLRDSLTDNTGQVVYRVERHERRSAADPWAVRAVWTATRTRQQAFRTEDNLRFIKLVFPVTAGQHWNGNAYLPAGFTALIGTRQVEVFKGWDYRFVSAGEPAEIGGRRYEDVATVRLADFETLIELRSAIEQYARGVGLIYREWTIFDTQCRSCCGGLGPTCQSTPWPQRVENGLIVRQRLIDFQ